MTPNPRVAACLFISVTVGVPLAHAAPDDKPPITLNPGTAGGEIAKQIDYGFCSGPQNAHAYPPNPVKVLLANCNSMSQTFTSTSVGPSTGVNCGGYAVAFGPLGHLSPQLHQITMLAEWADEPLTTAQACNQAKVTALAWGERCVNAACDQTAWDKIQGGPKQRHGKWDSATRKCAVEAKFKSENVHYKTLNLDIIADFPVGNQYVRKKAKGTIIAAKKGDCLQSVEVPAAKK